MLVLGLEKLMPLDVVNYNKLFFDLTAWVGIRAQVERVWDVRLAMRISSRLEGTVYDFVALKMIN